MGIGYGDFGAYVSYFVDDQIPRCNLLPGAFYLHWKSVCDAS